MSIAYLTINEYAHSCTNLVQLFNIEILRARYGITAHNQNWMAVGKIGNFACLTKGPNGFGNEITFPLTFGVDFAKKTFPREMFSH